MVTTTFDPFFSVKWGHLTTKALYAPYVSIITDPKAGDNHFGSSMYLYSMFILSTITSLLQNSTHHLTHNNYTGIDQVTETLSVTDRFTSPVVKIVHVLLQMHYITKYFQNGNHHEHVKIFTVQSYTL